MFAGLIILLKALFYLGCLFTIGVGFHVSLKLVDSRAWLRRASLILAVSLLIRLFALNLEMVGSIKGAVDFSMFSWLWPGVKNQIVAMFIGGIALWVASLRQERLWAFTGASLIAIGFGLSGHSQSVEGAIWAPFAVAIHVAVAGFWIMAPLSLWPRAALKTGILVIKLRRFSRMAVWSVPLMIALGLWLSVAISGSIMDLLQTSYGRILLFKLAVAIFAVGLGAFNKIYLTEMLETSQTKIGRRNLKRSLAAEASLFLLAIFAVATVTTTIGPNMH